MEVRQNAVLEQGAAAPAGSRSEEFRSSHPFPPERLPWWTARLQATRHLRHWVDPIAAGAPTQMWDARTSIRSVLWRGPWVAVGDAAWALDPLSGAGVERSIRCGLAAGRAVSAALLGTTAEPLRDYALEQVNAFRAAVDRQYRVYARVSRLKSAFWLRHSGQETP